MAIFITFTVYYFIRMGDLKNCLPGSVKIVDNPSETEDSSRTYEQQSTLTFLNLILLVQITIRLLYLVLVYDGIGQLVQLVISCLKDVVAFSQFFMFFITFFFLEFYIAGAQFSDLNYPEMS